MRAAAVLLAMLGAGTTAFVTVASVSDDPAAAERPATALGERGSTTTRAGERLTLVPEPESASPTEPGPESPRAVEPEPTDPAPEATQEVPSPTVTEELVEANEAATGAAPTTSPSPETATTSAPAPPDTTAPETSLSEDHPDGRTAVFSFSADEAASFSCSLDGGAWTWCVSPTTYSDLGSGWHTFAVRATDGSGNVDATPAETDWKANGAPGSDD
ncbi:MAG TPA: hypothetical protein VGD51_06150 [Nocardioidaceae bacterium]